MDMFEVIYRKDEPYLNVVGKLDPQTLAEALTLSIKKWQTIVNYGKYVNNGDSHTCALCLFYDSECESCPIGTSHEDCHNTPYVDYCNSEDNDEEAMEAAQREVEFLQSLVNHISLGG